MSTEEKNHSSSHSSGSDSHHHHHHSSSSKKRQHRLDCSEQFKRHGLSSIRRRKLISKWLLILLEVIALGVILVYIYVYLNT